MTPPSSWRPAPFGSAISTGPVVFLSYSHADAAVALTFREALANSGLEVIIDVDHLRPGEDLAEFGREAVRQADATICIVSTSSVSSVRGMFEAMTTLQQEFSDGEGRLIICVTDESVLGPGFRLQITKAIDSRVAELDALVSNYLIHNLDLTDLSSERSRLLGMRAGSGDVLDRARNSLSLILTPDTLRESAGRVAEFVRTLRGRSASRRDLGDIRPRTDELRHLAQATIEDARPASSRADNFHDQVTTDSSSRLSLPRRQSHLGSLFVCYRREDTQDAAGRLYDRLSATYSNARVFMDIDSVPLGIDFVEHVTKQIAGCSAVIVMIGRRWLTVKDRKRRRRLDDPDDLVRAEIRAALQQGIPVIPVIVQNATMPHADDLPEDIRPLVRRNGIQLRAEQWRDGVDRLLRELHGLLGGG